LLETGERRALNSFFRYFLFVVAAALASSVLGGAFASVVAVVSPGFVKGLFSTPEGPCLIQSLFNQMSSESQ
jgi:hypothetical protein